MASITMGKTMREHVVTPSKAFGNKSSQMTSIMEYELKGKRTPFSGLYSNTPTDLAALAENQPWGYHAAFRMESKAADDLRLCLEQMEAALRADSASAEQRDLVAKPVGPALHVFFAIRFVAGPLLQLRFSMRLYSRLTS